MSSTGVVPAPDGVFTNATESHGLSVKLWRGERMCLIGMDVAQAEPDFVGFSIEVQNPDNDRFEPLRNRLNFSYDQPAAEAVTGQRQFPSLEAPFQKFRWVHFPYMPKAGRYTYRVTKQHMPSDNRVVPGESVTLDIPLDPVCYPNFLDVGFARNFASSQAYAETFHNDSNVIPANADEGLQFHKESPKVYQWLGFEAYDLIFKFLGEVAPKPTRVDFFAYDLNEPDIVSGLAKLGNRLRAVIDNSGSHAPSTSAESQAARQLQAAGAQVKRMHFTNLQHNKVLIAKRSDGTPYKVLFGSTNFSFRGIYIQANNVVVLTSEDAAKLFEQVFELAFNNTKAMSSDPIWKQWWLVHENGRPPIHFCFSPHVAANLSLNPVGAAIDQATSSVFFAIAFLSQTKSGDVRAAINRLQEKNVFSYGISDKATSLHVNKPDGTVGIVDFNYLAKNAPEPFKTEWSGGKGIHEHHKFVVTDFSLPTAKVFTGSSNLSPSGEEGNGDNLVLIEDPRVATAYAIEALRVFDHLHFRSRMKDATNGAKGAKKPPKGKKDTLTLAKPTAISGKPAWFEEYYQKDSQREKDKELFSH